MNTRELYKSSPFLKARDFRGQDGRYRSTTVHIQDVKSVEAFNPKTRRNEPVWALFFDGKDKSLILNNHNIEMLEANLGGETDDWRGHTIGLYVSEGEKVGGSVYDVIRVRFPTEAPPTTKGESEPPADA